jgi:hypothetical protein
MTLSTESIQQPVTNPRGNTVRKAAFLALRPAIGMGILVYLAKTGQIQSFLADSPLSCVAYQCGRSWILAPGHSPDVHSGVHAISQCATVFLAEKFAPIEPDRLSLLHLSSRGGGGEVSPNLCMPPGRITGGAQRSPPFWFWIAGPESSHSFSSRSCLRHSFPGGCVPFACCGAYWRWMCCWQDL